jgi:hypothetical protein
MSFSPFGLILVLLKHFVIHPKTMFSLVAICFIGYVVNDMYQTNRTQASDYELCLDNPKTQLIAECHGLQGEKD